MQTMKAAVVREFGKPLCIEEVAIPEVTSGQVLVKVVASGVCHTDLIASASPKPIQCLSLATKAGPSIWRVLVFRMNYSIFSVAVLSLRISN